MRKMKTLAIIIVAVVLTLPCLAVEAAPLGTVDIVHSGYGAYDEHGLKVWGGGQYGTWVYGGVYMLDKTDCTGEGNIWPNDSIGSFCIELNEFAPDETLTYDVVVLEDVENSFLGETIGNAKADYLRELWGRFYDSAWAGDGPFCDAQERNAEAFAAAVWEIIYEDLPQSPLGWDVSVDGTPCSHGFSAWYVDADLANSWLHALDGTGPKADLRAFTNDGAQDYIVEVPEPATVALLGLGAAVTLLRRKRSAI